MSLFGSAPAIAGSRLMVHPAGFARIQVVSENTKSGGYGYTTQAQTGLAEADDERIEGSSFGSASNRLLPVPRPLNPTE